MNVLIVEDEAHTASLLQEIIEQNEDFIVTQVLETVVETVQYLSKIQGQLDLLFFDIQLADGKSFEIFKHIDVTLPVIFCTAFDDYTFSAIKNNGIDYVLKPFKDKEIQEALQKFTRLKSNFQANENLQNLIESETRVTYQQNFLTYQREKALIIPVKEVAVFELEFETLFLYTYTGIKHGLLKIMEYLESVCDPDQFFRINRQMLVNRNAITSFEPYFNRKIVLELKVRTEEKPVVSRLKVSPFKDWLEQ